MINPENAMKLFVLISISLVILSSSSCNNKPSNKNTSETIQKQETTKEIIKISTVTFVSGKDTTTAYLAEPEGSGPFPALIVIQEWWGLNDWITENANMFAEKGYVALAVDLYRGKSATSPDEAHELMRGLPEDRAIRDLKAAFTFLHERENVNKEKIGSIGWCMGGGYSLQTALNVPELKASVVCYGRLVTDESTVRKINCPLLGIFGEMDRGITPEDVKEFEESLNKEGKKNNIIIYRNVGHAFMNPNNKQGYNKEITDKAWNEIFTFLDQNLK